MPKTEIRSGQVRDAEITRADLNTGTAGSAVIAKAIQGALVSLSSTGADAGTGDVTFNVNFANTQRIAGRNSAGAGNGEEVTLSQVLDWIASTQGARLRRGSSTWGSVPAVTTLTDAATIATNASLGSYFRVTLGGNRTLGAPTNGFDGQHVTWELIQDGTGSRTLTLDTGTGGFAFGTDITSITLTTTASKADYLTAIYNSTANKWRVVGFVKGY